MSNNLCFLLIILFAAIVFIWQIQILLSKQDNGISNGSTTTALELIVTNDKRLYDDSFCNNANEIKVCSHQILNAPALDLDPTPPIDGSLKAMAVLWNSGVRCFDIDIVTLADGELLATHPARLAKHTNGGKSQDYTIKTLKTKLSAQLSKSFPLLNDVLEFYSKLIKQHQQVDTFYHSSDSSTRLHGPLLNIDLKGPKLKTEHLDDIMKKVQELGIVNNVAICVTALESGEIGPGIDILKELKSNSRRIPLGLTLRDRVKIDYSMSRIQELVEENPAIKLLVPSNKFDDDWYHNSFQNRLPIVSWVVDNEKDLRHALDVGVSGVVSNEPIKIKKWIYAIRSQCLKRNTRRGSAVL